VEEPGAPEDPDLDTIEVEPAVVPVLTPLA